MLDLDHPMTQHVFRASSLMDGVIIRGQRMSVSPSAVRAELLSECLPLFAEMRELAHAQFGKRTAFIAVAIDEFEVAILRLAALGSGRVTDDRRDGTGTCPLCSTEITHYPEHRIVLCSDCVKLFMVAHDKLDSSDGFGTWAI
jgi:hypothetical protein